MITIRDQRFGVEIEVTGATRYNIATAVAEAVEDVNEVSIDLRDAFPEELIAEIVSVEYCSSIAIVSFSAGSISFQLYGDQRVTEPLAERVGDQVRLFVRDVADWSWQPLDVGSTQ